MKRIATLGLTLLVFSLMTGGDTARAQKEALDPAKIVGEWMYVSGMRDGEKVEKDRLGSKVTFTKDRITVPAGPKEQFLMAYTVNPKASPATIDMDIKDGPIKEGKAVGIIAVEGDELKLCYVMADNKRPTKFESTKENGAFLFVLKRVK